MPRIPRPRRPRRPVRYAALTQHPNRKERCLLVHSWHPTAEEADMACYRLAMEYSVPNEDGVRVIQPYLTGLAVVHEDNIIEVVPGQEWTWARRSNKR